MNTQAANITVNVNQIWSAPMMGGRVLRRIRILAPHPDSGYLAEVLYTHPPLGSHEKIVRIGELAMIKSYKLEQDVCTHRHVDDYYRPSGHYWPATPNYYRCSDCGDLFPNTGDTNLWFPKLIAKGE